MNRQINYLLNNYKYSASGEDKNNQGILVPRYIATGRTAPNGTVYRPVSKTDEFDFVPVRSIITKTEGDTNIVTPDLLRKEMIEKASFPDGSAIGMSLGSSFSEATTQGLLGLKHGGHERLLQKDGNLYAPKDKAVDVVEDGQFIVLKVGRKEQRYPRPSNWVGMGKTHYEAGELIGTAYHTASPAYKLAAVIRLMMAKGSAGKKYYEKDQVIESDCYAYEDGIINYIEDKNGNITVQVGPRTYAYCPEAMYYFPDGAKVRKYERICSGIVNMRQVITDLPGDINSAFIIFRDQYYQLTSKDFAKDHVVNSGDMQEEIVELIFAGLTKVIPDAKTGKIESLQFQGTQNAVLGRDSFFTTLSYGWSNRIVGKALKGELNIKDDIMTETVLGLLLNDDLDVKKK